VCHINRYTGTEHVADILRYSISLDKIEKVSSLSTATDLGLALQSSDRKYIYFFGGTVVHKFNMETNFTVQLPTALPSPVRQAGGVSTNGTLFIFNGKQRNVLEFNTELEIARIIGDLPFGNGTTTVYSTTAMQNGQDGVWLFAGNQTKASNPLLLFNTENKSVYIPTSANSTLLPTLHYGPASVSDGHRGYIIGGIGRSPEDDGSYHPTNGILT
jgi:hypothetical protein